MRVVVAEDNMLTREGIVSVLTSSGVEVVAVADQAAGLLAAVERERPDAAIVDIRMPPTHTDEGLVAARAIRADHPDTVVLVLSQYVETAYALRLLDEHPEGLGYLLKDRVVDVPAFLDAVRRVAAGGSALDPEVVSRLVGRRRADDPLYTLTPRERDVLSLMAEGRSNRGIAEALGVSGAAVEKHATAIFAKLGLGREPGEHRRVMAVLTLLRAG